MQTSISLPDDTFERADAALAAVGRSSFVDRLCGGPAPDLDEIHGVRHSTRHP